MIDIDREMIAYATSTAPIAKLLVDIIKISVPRMPGRFSPLLALVLSIAVLLLFRVAYGGTLDGQVIAQSILAGIMAASGAVALTEAQTYAEIKRGGKP